MKPITAEELAYLAGILDGEGSICLARDSHANRYIPRIDCITNTSQEGLKYVTLLIDKFLGFENSVNIHWDKRRTSFGKIPCGTISLYSINAQKFAKALKPYLVIKKKQLDLVIRFFDESDKFEQQILFLAMRALNSGKPYEAFR